MIRGIYDELNIHNFGECFYKSALAAFVCCRLAGYPDSLIKDECSNQDNYKSY